MTDIIAKTRFAPSPTGLMHLGNLRTALFNALLARRLSGSFLLRIEDTDAERSRAEFDAALGEDLLWLGLAWQEGPAVGGEHGPYRQSERADVYQHYYDALEQAGLVYPCFCSERELKLSRKAQRAAGKPPRYAGTCGHLNADEVAAKRAQGLESTLRFRVPRGEVVEFEDLVRGPQRFLTDDIGDFIIRRADGTPAFFFSNAIDDSRMGVTHVLRGEDHLTNTPRQLLLLRALDMREPSYGHISMIVGPDGSPLSKRHGSRSVRELRESGYLPAALLNYLARLGHHYEDNSLMSLEALAQGFELSQLGRAPARFDEAQLLHWQREAVAQADTATLLAWVGEEVPPGQAERFVEAVRANIAFPHEMQQWSEVVFGDRAELDADGAAVMREAGADFFAAAREAYAASGGDYKAFIDGVKTRTGVKGKGLFLPLRLAFTGRPHGPELAPLLELLGSQRVDARLERAQRLAATE